MISRQGDRNSDRQAVVEVLEDGWIDIGPIETHYSYAGDRGPAVLLLHGGGPGMSGAAGFGPLFEPIAARGFRAIAPDQLSMGYTDARPHAWPVNGFQSLIDHVAGFIEALGLDDLCLVGHSQGSYVAARYALDYPERVRSVLFLSSGTIGSAMGVPNPENRGVKAVKAFDGTLEGLRAMMAATVGAAGTDGRDLDAMSKQLFAAVDRPGVADARAAFEAARDRLYASPEELERFSLRDRMPKLAIPARFVWGKEDLIAPLAMGRELAELLPRIPFTFVDDCGHNVQYGRPEIVLQALFALLDKDD